MKFNAKTVTGTAIFGIMAAVALVSCGKKEKGLTWAKGTSSETIVKEAYSAKGVGNWGLGNEYEILALLKKYDLGSDYVTQDFTMDSFDDGTIPLASAMTYNELGLVKNSYSGALNYGDTVGTIDMNTEGVAMLEDNIFCTRAFATANPNTVKAFVYASMKGWAYAAEHPAEAAEIVYAAGTSVSPEHQAFMASEVAKLVTTDTTGATVDVDGVIKETAMAQTLSLAKQYISLSDSTASTKLAGMTTADIYDNTFAQAAKESTDGNFGTLEKTSVTIQLKWLNQAQFMGYFVAKAKGYYTDCGFTNVTIAELGGDYTEITRVSTGGADFGVTWVSSLIAANAGGLDLVEVAQVYQRSGLVLVYKYAD